MKLYVRRLDVQKPESPRELDPDDPTLGMRVGYGKRKVLKLHGKGRQSEKEWTHTCCAPLPQSWPYVHLSSDLCVILGMRARGRVWKADSKRGGKCH
jgi:hypothetical protein